MGLRRLVRRVACGGRSRGLAPPRPLLRLLGAILFLVLLCQQLVACLIQPIGNLRGVVRGMPFRRSCPGGTCTPVAVRSGAHTKHLRPVDILAMLLAFLMILFLYWPVQPCLAKGAIDFALGFSFWDLFAFGVSTIDRRTFCLACIWDRMTLCFVVDMLSIRAICLLVAPLATFEAVSFKVACTLIGGMRRERLWRSSGIPPLRARQPCGWVAS